MKIPNKVRNVYLYGEQNDVVSASFSMNKISDRIAHNTVLLSSKLKISDIVRVEIKTVRTPKEFERHKEDVRLYVYHTGNCNVAELGDFNVSHAIQSSLGTDRKGWREAEGLFLAKVFPHTEEDLLCLVEDMALDIQMYYHFGHDKLCDSPTINRKYSNKKAQFLKKFNRISYLGDIEEGAEYGSIASFCRNNNRELDIDLYIEEFNQFNKIILDNVRSNNLVCILDKECIDSIKKAHPKGNQISIRKVKKLLSKKEEGLYLLVRIEKRPKVPKNTNMIAVAFGGKIRIGKIKIVPYSQKVEYEKMAPYVSLFMFRWKG